MWALHLLTECAIWSQFALLFLSYDAWAEKLPTKRYVDNVKYLSWRVHFLLAQQLLDSCSITYLEWIKKKKKKFYYSKSLFDILVLVFFKILASLFLRMLKFEKLFCSFVFHFDRHDPLKSWSGNFFGLCKHLSSAFAYRAGLVPIIQWFLSNDLGTSWLWPPCGYTSVHLLSVWNHSFSPNSVYWPAFFIFILLSFIWL